MTWFRALASSQTSSSLNGGLLIAVTSSSLATWCNSKSAAVRIGRLALNCLTCRKPSEDALS